MTRRTILTTLGASALAIGLWAPTGTHAQGIVTGTMTLSMSDGACTKTLVGNDDGSRMRAKRGATIQWVVVNQCSADATVALGDWTEKSSGGNNNPFDPSGKSSCSAAPGKQCIITLHVRGNATVTVYSYSTSVNGTKRDPDLIIEM